MAKYEDYVKSVTQEETVLEEEIVKAGDQQTTREESTPDSNWEERYKNLEVAYSRQGQQMGDYRKLIDDYVSTPEPKPEDLIEVNPITPDDIYENPDEAVRRAVDSHPAMQRVEKLEQDLESAKRDTAIAEFEGRHPNYETTFNSPEFANWVNENPMRNELVQRAATLDMASADALFALWEAQQTPSINAEQAATIEAASLESGSGAEPIAPDRYSRSAMLQQKIRAKQGDVEADAYVRAHAVSYREALVQGTVRD